MHGEAVFRPASQSWPGDLFRRYLSIYLVAEAYESHPYILSPAKRPRGQSLVAPGRSGGLGLRASLHVATDTQIREVPWEPSQDFFLHSTEYTLYGIEPLPQTAPFWLGRCGQGTYPAAAPGSQIHRCRAARGAKRHIIHCRRPAKLDKPQMLSFPDPGLRRW